MAFTNLWKIFVRDGGNETDEQEDDYYRTGAKENGAEDKSENEDGVAFHGVRRREPAMNPINETTDERVEDVEDDEEEEKPIVPEPIDMTAPRQDAGEEAAETETDVSDETAEPAPAEEEDVPAAEDEDLYAGKTVAAAEPDEYAAPAAVADVPEFKLIHVKDLACARHAVDMLARGYVIIADTSSLGEEMLGTLTCFLAGAVYALGGHIYPADETNAFLSLSEFDPTPYLPDEDGEDENDESAGEPFSAEAL